MIIEPAIRSNICINAHPLGSRQFVNNQIAEVKRLGTFEGPKNVLIIGGSSGYGLATRIALAYGANANTLNVSFEQPPGKRTGLAGWWNNIFFQEAAASLPTTHHDINADAFAAATKRHAIDVIRASMHTIDLLVYSLASPVRMDETTQTLVRSSIKTIGEEVTGTTIDIVDLNVRDLTVGVATPEEIRDTVFVMGGSDWASWVETLDQAGVLAPGFKTIAYTYIGGKTTANIYRGGTLGQAKEDLERHAVSMNARLREKYAGEALISSSKAVVTKASVFIPQMPVYVSCIYDVMLRRGVHETITEHKYRLFKDMVYGTKRIVDDQGRIRLDHLEMDPAIQAEAIALMKATPKDQICAMTGAKLFIDEFYKMNGFRHQEIDYAVEVDLEQLANLPLR